MANLIYGKMGGIGEQCCEHAKDSNLEKLQIFDCGANPALTCELCKIVGTKLGDMTLTHYADGELNLRVNQSVRGCDIFVVQSTCSPVAENLMKLLVVIDALRRASAQRITAVLPYYGYARQDKKFHGREPITGKLVANLITVAGADRIIAIDLHTPSIQGFFDIPVDHLSAMNILATHIREQKLPRLVVVSPDAGGVHRARTFAKILNAPLAIIDKRRPKPNEVVLMNIIGDVKDCTALLVDDMIDTAGTICAGAEALLKNGAKTVYALASHGVFSGPAIERLSRSPIEKIVISNSIPLAHDIGKKIVNLSIAPLIGEAIKRIHLGESVSSLFNLH